MTPAAIVVTLNGGPSLAGFPAFWLRAAVGFDPSAPGATCLRGPYLRVHGSRVPPMNTATPYTLPPSAHAIYVFGRSAGGEDFHAPLAHAPGERVELPLSPAPPVADVERAAHLLATAPWTFAKTMAHNPHEYTQRKHWHDADFAFCVEHIRRWGYRQQYGKGTYVVLDSGDHFHWSMGWPTPSTILINRKPLDGPAVALGEQVFTALDAALVPIPSLPEDFGGVPTAMTICPFFRCGVALFGWPLPDRRPRLRKRRGVSALEV